MQRNIFISGLTMLSLLFVSATSIHAELASDINLKIQNIERAADNETEDNEQPVRKRSNPQRNNLAANNAKSMRYIELGTAEHKSGNLPEAAMYYYQAVKADETNGYGYMGIALIAGGTKDGINCMKAAAMLFKMQQKSEEYAIAITWLEQHGVSE